MYRNMSLYVCGLMLVADMATAAEPSILPPPVRVTTHLYAWIGPHGGPDPENRGFRMNMGFVVGRDAVAVIESGYHEPMVREMLGHIRSVTKAPVRYVINTNSQPDRFLGNEYFRQQGAQIIASRPEAARMANMGATFAEVTERALGLVPGSIRVPGPPDRIVDQDTELDLGGIKIQLVRFAAAHTPGPLVIHIPSDNAVYAGDVLYSGRLPAVINGGSIASWLDGFERLRSFGNAIFVPGHGKPGRLVGFEFPTRDYLEFLLSEMRKAVEQGKDMQDAMAGIDQSRFASLENYQDLAGRNASFAYIEAEAELFRR